MPWYESVLIAWITVGVPALLTLGWKKGIRPMMVALGEVLDSTKTIAQHSQRLTQIEAKLNEIERNTHSGK